jgi:hypothetical protein
MTGDMLIMELTLEQGSPRETQVQPPKDVWQRYFGVPVARGTTWRRVFTLRNKRDAGPDETRRISSHDHNWTIEIRGAMPPRPAILRMNRVSRSRFEYWVYRPADPEYAHCEWLLSVARNPFHRIGRQWLVI